MLAALKAWAEDEFRSTNGQLEYILRQALREAGRLSDADADADTDSKGESGSGPGGKRDDRGRAKR